MPVTISGNHYTVKLEVEQPESLSAEGEEPVYTVGEHVVCNVTLQVLTKAVAFKEIAVEFTGHTTVVAHEGLKPLDSDDISTHETVTHRLFANPLSLLSQAGEFEMAPETGDFTIEPGVYQFKGQFIFPKTAETGTINLSADSYNVKKPKDAGYTTTMVSQLPSTCYFDAMDQDGEKRGYAFVEYAVHLKVTDAKEVQDHFAKLHFVGKSNTKDAGNTATKFTTSNAVYLQGLPLPGEKEKNKLKKLLNGVKHTIFDSELCLGAPLSAKPGETLSLSLRILNNLPDSEKNLVKYVKSFQMSFVTHALIRTQSIPKMVLAKKHDWIKRTNVGQFDFAANRVSDLHLNHVGMELDLAPLIDVPLTIPHTTVNSFHATNLKVYYTIEVFMRLGDLEEEWDQGGIDFKIVRDIVIDDDRHAEGP